MNMNMFVRFYAICLSFFTLFHEYSGQTHSITILFIHEEANNIAHKSVEAALEFINKNSSLQIQVDMTEIFAFANDSENILNTLCKTYNNMVLSNSAPHVVLDTTNLGLISEVVKYFTLSLALPTISSSYGELREWRNITNDEKKYLIRVLPPNDVVIDIIKAITIKLQTSDLAVLYDHNFVSPEIWIENHYIHAIIADGFDNLCFKSFYSPPTYETCKID